MKDIGQKLKKERIKKGLSYNDITGLTKLPENKIRAIEEGNLDFFIEDITFLRFYVRSYCKALEIPYDDMKVDISEKVLDYTTSINLKKDLEKEELQQNIKVRANKNRKPEVRDKSSISLHNRKRKKIDTSFFSLIFISTLVLGIVVYIGVGLLMNANESTPEEPEDIIETTTPTPEVEEEVDEEEIIEEIIAFSEVDANNYEMTLENVEEVEMQITFSDACYFEITLNGAKLDLETNYAMLYADDSVITTLTLEEDDILGFKFGNFPTSLPIITMNGENFEYNVEGLTNSYSSVIQIYLQLKGE